MFLYKQPSNENEFEFSDFPPTGINTRTRSRATVHIEYPTVSRVSPSILRASIELHDEHLRIFISLSYFAIYTSYKRLTYTAVY